MKEYGDRRSELGVLLCEVKDCNLNQVALILTREEAVLCGVDHEIIKNHPVIVLDFDRDHSVHPGLATKILYKTGVRIPEDLIGQP
jgi:hypothetical protein